MKNRYSELASQFDGDVSNIDKNVLDAICSEPWAITPEGLDTILLIANRANEVPEAILTKAGTQTFGSESLIIRGNTAVLPVSGPIFRYANLFTQMSGATSIELMARDFGVAMNNPSIKRIILDIDSPGGQVTGVSEMASIIREASVEKEVIAYVGGAGASAAYWLASAASRIYLSNTSMVGSIGVIMTAREGAEKGIIKIKSTQSPNKQPNPETDTGKAQLQSLVDELAQVFISTVASYRGVSEKAVMEEFGQGGVLVGASAVAVGMADGVSSLETLIAGKSGATKEVITMSKDTENQSPDITADFIKVNHPAIAEQFRTEGASSIDKESIRAEGYSDGVAAEQERYQGIIALAIPGHEKLVASLVADTTVTPEMAAIKIINAQQEQRSNQLAAVQRDGGDVVVPISKTKEEDVGADADVSALSPEQAWEKMTADQRAEYGGDYEAFTAYVEASEDGLVSIFKQK